MKLKNMWKRFWTLDVHNHAGFTLVELIIVIAILAILSTGAIAGYSAYVEKANKTADIAMLSEIENVLLMAYYNGDLSSNASIVLDANGVVKASDNVAQIMTDAYGGNWRTALKLKYGGWVGEESAATYVGTSYHGNEASLLNEVDRLTNALGGAVKDYSISLGDNFTGFLNGYGLSGSSSANEIGNAAALYVAQQTAGNEQFIQDTFAKNLTSDNFINDTFNALAPKVGDAAALAAIYAYAEGFAQYCDAQEGSTTNAVDVFHSSANFDNVTDAAVALGAIETAFNALGVEGGKYVSSYMATDGAGLKDLAGYVGIMGTVNNNKDVVDGNLAADDCFTDGTVENMLNGYAAMGTMGVSTDDGQVAVVLTFDKDGAPMIHYSDLELNAK